MYSQTESCTWVLVRSIGHLEQQTGSYFKEQEQKVILFKYVWSTTQYSRSVMTRLLYFSYVANGREY